MAICLMGLIGCGDSEMEIDLSGEWEAIELTRSECEDASDNRVVEYTDGCVTSEFGNTFCITMTLEDGNGTFFRTENGDPFSDDLFVVYIVDQEAMTLDLTIDGVKRTGSFTENEIVVMNTSSGCMFTERFVRR